VIENIDPQLEADGLGGFGQRPIGLNVKIHRTWDIDPFDYWSGRQFRVGRQINVKIMDGFVRIDEPMMISRLTYTPGPETWDATLVRMANLQ
jgi:hypothetical protein